MPPGQSSLCFTFALAVVGGTCFELPCRPVVAACCARPSLVNLEKITAYCIPCAVVNVEIGHVVNAFHNRAHLVYFVLPSSTVFFAST